MRLADVTSNGWYSRKLHAMGDPRIERPFPQYEILGERAFCASVGISSKKRFENEFMQFQVLMGRESYDILEST